ncbi:DUF58 domain-containing protein [Aestuariispira insulae]|uniref:Uncharacterized protein DUF58 n=1 Tax=Aestuariispira insulae TaxID=1461337 RepID=A0A3D9HEZ5_9PROT|nr:DUF58 domain-containing protein [Aestuariispira insulae]RED48025.1 uncharacterized protein DUF58 [Aestuariispira insulae]
MRKQHADHNLTRDQALSLAEHHVADMPGLMIEAERVAATVDQGIHGRRRTGQGESFWQYRAFHQGDSAAQVDWRRSAKSDSLYVRESEWEASQTVWAWRDSSPSMAFRSVRGLPTKLDRATVLTLGLAILLLRSGERIGLMDGVTRAGSGKATLHRLAEALTLTPGKVAGIGADTLERGLSESLPAPLPLPPFGQVVLISDFLAPMDKLLGMMEAMADRRQKGLLWLITDPAEEALPYRGRVRFSGLEEEGMLLVRKAQSLRSEYREKRHAHYAALRDQARRLGWQWLEHRTDMPAETALLAAFQSLSHDRGGADWQARAGEHG